MAMNSHHNYLLVHGADGMYIICPACPQPWRNLIQSDQWPAWGEGYNWGESGLYSHWHVVGLSLIPRLLCPSPC